jgi:hypothetical protein
MGPIERGGQGEEGNSMMSLYVYNKEIENG